MPPPLHIHAPATLLLSLLAATAMPLSAAEPFEPNYDESKIPAFTLPDPLLSSSGEPVTTAKAWTDERRPEILQLFETHVYGRAPASASGIDPAVSEISRDDSALDGKATRIELKIRFPVPDAEPLDCYLLYYLPNAASEPAPAFLGLNFNGNHTIHPDPGIHLSTTWMRQTSKSVGVVDHRATEAARGSAARRWPVETIIDRGYALATLYYGDIDPDFDDGFENGIHGAFRKPGVPLAPDDWGSIAAWAWGLSRVLDVLESEKAIDAERVALLGHSRLGKTSLWAGARDERFALVISNNSGCGGAALSRRAIGETVGRINTSFPHWFCDNFLQYNRNENALPVDQHMLIALIAPRPAYVASAEEDQWADPRGEFLSALHAGPVYALFDKEGVGVEAMPDVNQPVGDTVGYHIRTGKHDVTEYDWERYLNFADRHLKLPADEGPRRRPPPPSAAAQRQPSPSRQR